jgi:hypothetical protein
VEKRFGDTMSKSAWIRQLMKKELDALDGIDIENELHEKIVKEITPELRKFLESANHTQVLEYWRNKEARKKLSSSMNLTVDDADIKKALHEVLLEKEGRKHG